jgi:hypothetical protein
MMKDPDKTRRGKSKVNPAIRRGDACSWQAIRRKTPKTHGGSMLLTDDQHAVKHENKVSDPTE